MQCSSLVHPRHHLVLGAVEAVDPDDAGFLLGIGIVRVGGIEVVLKDRQPVEVFNLEGTIQTPMRNLGDARTWL